MRLQCLVWALCLGVGVHAGGKYSREVNDPKASDGDKQEVEFRIAKLNQVWEKANRVRMRARWLQSFGYVAKTAASRSATLFRAMNKCSIYFCGKAFIYLIKSCLKVPWAG